MKAHQCRQSVKCTGKLAMYLWMLVAAALVAVSIIPASAQTISCTVWQPGASSMWYEGTAPDAEAEQFVATTTLGEKEPVVVALWSEQESGPVELTVDFPTPVEVRIVGFTRHNFQGKLWGVPRWLWPSKDESSVAGHENKAGAGRNVAWWLTISAPDRPGLLKGTVTIHFEDGKTISRPLQVRVLPIRLPRADIAFGFYFNKGRLPEYAQTDEWKMAIYRDMADHGHTSVTFYSYGDWSQLPPQDSIMLHSLPLAKQAGLIHPDIPCMALLGGSDWQGKLASNDEAVAWLQTQCQENGWPELLLYGPDEPDSAQRALDALPIFEKIHGHGMRTVTANCQPGLAYLGQLTDVWISFATHDEDINSGLFGWAKLWNKEVWTYITMLRATNARWNRQYAGLYTWGWDFKGNFPWAYTHDKKYALHSDGSGNPDVPFGFVLPTPDGLVTSVGWEGRREGIKDYRALQMLEDLVQDKQGGPAAEARQFLENVHGAVQRADFWHGHEPAYGVPSDHHDLYIDPYIDVDTVRAKTLSFIQDLQ